MTLVNREAAATPNNSAAMILTLNLSMRSKLEVGAAACPR
jgi:hypothetical protein